MSSLQDLKALIEGLRSLPVHGVTLAVKRGELSRLTGVSRAAAEAAALDFLDMPKFTDSVPVKKEKAL